MILMHVRRKHLKRHDAVRYRHDMVYLRMPKADYYSEKPD